MLNYRKNVINLGKIREFAPCAALFPLSFPPFTGGSGSTPKGNKKTQYISLTESAKKDMKTHSENSQEIMQSIFNGALSENERMQMLTATETLLNIFEKCCAFADTDNKPVQPAHVHFSYDLTQHVLSSKTSPFANRKNKKTP